ncbi:ubiquitin-conjugating enzyme E2 U isoform X1 [Apteryx mantelli]|uniref:Ubiquitin-conjugating enzyme E2 U isoform X1 n=1 Tax=Apteryx mantelli TaxID=2696672 RepID=A0ABM4EXL9_9AVES
MCCRARRLLGREYREHRAARLFGILARPVSDNFLEWLAEVRGLKDSLWEGAVLQLSLTYSEKYNDVPPAVKFNTIPFHPNVNRKGFGLPQETQSSSSTVGFSPVSRSLFACSGCPLGWIHFICLTEVEQYSGRPCIDFLDNPEEWKEKLTISNILLAIQVMLSNPITENAVNAEAAEMLKNNMPLYRQMVMQCVRNSLHPEELPHTEKDRVSSLKFYQPAEGSSLGSARGIRRISFEDYHRTWSRIATSKARDHFKDSFFEDPEFIGSYCGWKAKNEKGTEDWGEDTCTAIISQLIRKQRKQTAGGVSEMSKIELENYQLCQSPDVPDLPSERQTVDEDGHDNQEELWEKEVDNLVAWTNTLSNKRLED